MVQIEGEGSVVRGAGASAGLPGEFMGKRKAQPVGETKNPLTIDEARAHLVNTAGGPFNQTVMIVTTDMDFACSAVRYERMKPWHFIWTEHHGFFMEHDDEVQFIHVRTTYHVTTGRVGGNPDGAEVATAEEAKEGS